MTSDDVGLAVLQAFLDADQDLIKHGSKVTVLNVWLEQSGAGICAVYETPNLLPGVTVGYRWALSPLFFDDNAFLTGWELRRTMEEPLGTNAEGRASVDPVTGIWWYGDGLDENVYPKSLS